MALILTSLLLLASRLAAQPTAPSTPSKWDPMSQGPFTPTPPIIMHGRNASMPGFRFDVLAFAPKEPGEYPVMVFVPGFATRPARYTGLINHIVSHGIAVLGVDIPVIRTAVQGIDKRVKDLTTVMDYINGSSFNDVYHNFGGNANVTFDIKERLGLMAHSIGGHASLHMVDVISCFNIRFLALFDPVDGIDPYGFEGQYLVPLGANPNYHLKFTTPVALIMSGLAGVPLPLPSILHWPACAPDDRTGYHWYDSLLSPKWMLNFTDYGHLDLLDDYYSTKANLICPKGSGAKTPEGRDNYRRGLGALVVALAEAVLPAMPKAPEMTQEEFLLWLEEPAHGLSPLLNVTATFDRSSNLTAAPVEGVCRWKQSPSKEVFV